MTQDTCPKCGGEVNREEADVGVGIIYGPAYCMDPDCGWDSNPPEFPVYHDAQGNEHAEF